MREQHLSDEAIAAFADDVLCGPARERARRHTTSCAECGYAVAVQREAVWALRAAPAPSLPIGLMQRLRDVPGDQPDPTRSVHLDEQGGPVFASFGTAAPVTTPVPASSAGKSRRGRAVVMTAASVVMVGALTGTAVAEMGSSAESPGRTAPVNDRTTNGPGLVSVVSPFRPW